MTRLKAAIVGATGMAGQQFVLALSNHPQFEVVQMVTSRDKRTYEQALQETDGSSRWTQGVDLPADMKDVPVVASDRFEPDSVDVIFTAVESDLAHELEPRYGAVRPTFSTASAFRYEADTPLIVPGVNDHHAAFVKKQQAARNWKGFVLPIPNCTTTGLAITLQPLYQHFQVNRVLMVSMQAVSGAGRSPGVRTLDSLDNIIPFIPKEEEKVRREVQKILGTQTSDTIAPATIDINCICTRAAVLEGHTEAVFAGFSEPVSVDDVKRVFREHNPIKGRNLHSAADEWIHVFDDPFRPQVRLDRDRGDGMTTSVGRVEEEPILGGVKYLLVSHNTKMGAGKGAVLLAECALEQGLI